MHGNAFEPIQIPAWVWDRDESRERLKNRDVAGLFNLAVKYAGALANRRHAQDPGRCLATLGIT
ncbi:hypothetical protein ACQP1K_07845 [Sphaerimonospora sp. CA-214678]|uniref:hypothetical protein n=1 Tax=Sphaerimonospora sp. CA-214678 TaxID=3240029 RepID=UPI003D8AB948